MSRRQRDELEQMLRDAPLDLGGDVAEQRAIFQEMMDAAPVADDVTATPGTLGGVPVVTVEVAGLPTTGTLLYVHGGAYAIGSADAAVGLASELARRSRTRAIAVDYRLAPEHPHPAGLHDVVGAFTALAGDGDAGPVAIAGESSGGGLVAATLRALRDEGRTLPVAAALMSPWVDLTLSGASAITKAPVDPALTAEGLRRRAADYAGDRDLDDPAVSPVLGDLRGLPPLLIQAGSHEILLDDAVRLAARAAADDVAVTLEVTPDVPHVFQAYWPTLDEGSAALTAAAEFLSGHLAAV